MQLWRVIAASAGLRERWDFRVRLSAIRCERSSSGSTCGFSSRTTRSVALTEAGTELLAQLGPVLSDLEVIFDDLAERQGERSGTLRINAPEPAARLLMRHVAPEFFAAHPRMRLDIVSEGRFVDIVAQGFDAGMRLAEAVPQDMIAIPFGGARRLVSTQARRLSLLPRSPSRPRLPARFDRYAAKTASG